MSFGLQESIASANLPLAFSRTRFEEPPPGKRAVLAPEDLQRVYLEAAFLHITLPPAPRRRVHRKTEAVMADLKALRAEEVEAEHPITDFSFLTASAILSVAYSEIHGEVPLPAISSDEEGGIRIEWARDRRYVKAVIPSDNTMRAYIYYRRDDESGIDRLSGVKLAERLRSIILEP